MDNTLLFKAYIKTIKTRNKALGFGTEEKSKLLKPQPRKDDFIIKCREVLRHITKLRDFLIEHRKAYLNFSNHIPNLPQMSDFERNQLDSGAQQVMKTCAKLIQDLKNEILMKEVKNVQLSEHRSAVIELMREYLKKVCKIYSELRAVREKHSVDRQKMSKINPSTPEKKAPLMSNDVEEKNKHIYSETTDLTTEELQMFESENEQLFNELNTLSEEVKQIEKKVVKIAELQEIFTEKVLEQDQLVNRIVTTAVGTTENVRDANEQIRQAIQRNAGFRVWILFFLLVMSFSLLFLDWYND